MTAVSQNETNSPATRTGVVPGRGGALDLLRVLAAVLIVLYHFGQNAPVELEALHPVFGRGYLATMSESAKAMGALIDDLLAFSRMGRAELQQSDVPLGPLVAEFRG